MVTMGAYVAKRAGGRPKKSEEGGETRQVRVFADLADMLSEIAEVEGESTANLLDPVIRAHIVARHKRWEKEIALIRKAKDQLRRAIETASEKAHRQTEGG